jgi:hypothetical protein
VICAFERFLVLDPDAGWDKPVDDIPLAELPERLAALRFLAGREPHFRASHADLSREAVAALTDLYGGLQERAAADHDQLREFILQTVWCMFAEDLGILPDDLLKRILEGLLKDPKRSSADELGQLFDYLARKEPRPTAGSFYEKTPYANGGLFQHPARVHLAIEELTTLRETCNLDWRHVEPAIFGAILQGALGKEKQWALGAHYTAEADIMKAVGPTVVEPWQERVEGCDSVSEAEAAWRDLMSYIVLDPACGSGNFLYVAYRELRGIEARLRQRLAELRTQEGITAQEELEFFPISNMKGIEIEPFAVELARVVLWMGHKLAADKMSEQGVSEPTLPLADLSGIQRGNALHLGWPQADAIVGNPPYHGSNKLRDVVGDREIEWLKDAFGVGVKDYAVYWFRKTQERLEGDGRAGLVATNSVTQNRNRKPSLEWIAENGGVITNAVSKQEWTGDANVNVSIVNWIKEPAQPPTDFLLDGVEVDAISPALQPADLDVTRAERLSGNSGFSFQGPNPAGAGFVVTPAEAEALLSSDEADYARVVRPYLIAEDITEDPLQAPRRWIIDFAQMDLEEANQYPAALEIVKHKVKPARDKVRRKSRRERWWRFGEVAVGMRRAVDGLDRFIVGTRVSKRLLFAWCRPRTLPADATNIFAFPDYYAMGILCSNAHDAWAWGQSSTMRTDLRYTPTSVFETFAWPQASSPERESVARACTRVIERRGAICSERDFGLTELYNEVGEGAYADLRDLHLQLDRAVVAAYGWPSSVAEDRDESNRRLLELNLAIVAGEVDYAGPGWH